MCGKKVCLEPAEVKRSLGNKVAIIRYIEQTNALIDFYESRTGGTWDGSLAQPEAQPRSRFLFF